MGKIVMALVATLIAAVVIVAIFVGIGIGDQFGKTDKFGLMLDNTTQYASQGMTGAVWFDGHYDADMSASMSGFVQLEAGHNHTFKVQLLRSNGEVFWQASGSFYAPKDNSGIYIIHIDWETHAINSITHLES